MDLATFFKISKLKFISLEIERVTRSEVNQTNNYLSGFVFFEGQSSLVLSILVKNAVKFKEFHQNLKSFFSARSIFSSITAHRRR
jgi:hypothetical protein